MTTIQVLDGRTSPPNPNLIRSKRPISRPNRKNKITRMLLFKLKRKKTRATLLIKTKTFNRPFSIMIML
jgi:hypothetical protein